MVLGLYFKRRRDCAPASHVTGAWHTFLHLKRQRNAFPNRLYDGKDLTEARHIEDLHNVPADIYDLHGAPLVHRFHG